MIKIDGQIIKVKSEVVDWSYLLDWSESLERLADMLKADMPLIHYKPKINILFLLEADPMEVVYRLFYYNHYQRAPTPLKVNHDPLAFFNVELANLCKLNEYGAKKYSRRSWLKMPDGYQVYTQAMIRHWFAASYKKNDDESGATHLTAALWNALARRHFNETQ